MNVVMKDVTITLTQSQVDLMCKIAEQAYPLFSFIDYEEKVQAAVEFLLRKVRVEFEDGVFYGK